MKESQSETVFGVAAVVAGLGVVALGLFPLALPFAILLGVAALPLLPVAIVAGALAAVLAAPVLAVRAVRRRRADERRGAALAAPHPRPHPRAV